MTKFFDWCDRYKRLFFILLFAAIVLCFIFPLCDYAVKDAQGNIVDIIKLPFMYVIFIYGAEAFNIITTILLALSLLFCILFSIFPSKKNILGCNSSIVGFYRYSHLSYNKGNGRGFLCKDTFF